MRGWMWGVLAGLSLMATPAAAETLRFHGDTAANGTLIRDALRNVQLVGQGRFECGVISEVEAAVLPASYKLADMQRLAKGADVIYERWIVTLCGRKEPFLIGFWPAREGGVMFNVRHPYPDDAPQAAR
jgi:hypothetical protein